jgi:hypothetical protein
VRDNTIVIRFNGHEYSGNDITNGVLGAAALEQAGFDSTKIEMNEDKTKAYIPVEYQGAAGVTTEIRVEADEKGIHYIANDNKGYPSLEKAIEVNYDRDHAGYDSLEEYAWKVYG